MSHRVFVNSQGIEWDVWPVVPEFAERRRASPASAAPAIERRVRKEYRVPIAQQWAGGWLAFECNDEKRRLAPFPPDWAERPDAELERLCAAAKNAHRAPRRLIE